MKNEDVVRSIKIIYEIFWKFVFFFFLFCKEIGYFLI